MQYCDAFSDIWHIGRCTPPGIDPTMMRTVTLKLRCDEAQKAALLATMEAYTTAFDISAHWGFKNHSDNPFRHQYAIYYYIRDQVPELPAALVQSAIRRACVALKEVELKRQPVRRRLAALQYHRRSIRISTEHGFATISTVAGRIRSEFTFPEHFKKYSEWTVRSATVTYRKRERQFYLGVIVEKNAETQAHDGEVLGIDRGLNNIAVTSDGRFFNSKKLRGIRGKHAHNRATLQAKGTRSARRRLRKMSGRERRFVACVNHNITRELVDGPHATFVLEDLVGIAKCRKMSTPMRTKLAKWPYHAFERLLIYKAEEVGKRVIKVSPFDTSRRCSSCGLIRWDNRSGPDFKCLRCGKSLHADLNAARNIALAGRSGLGRLEVNQPNAPRVESQTLQWDSGSEERRCEFLVIASEKNRPRVRLSRDS